MGFPRRPRPTPTQRDKSSSTSSDSTPKSSTSAAAPSSKRPKLSKDALVFDRQHIRVYIVVAKLEGEEIRRLTQLVEDNGGKCVARVEEATVVLSKTKVWNRLRKYLPERGYDRRKIVTVDWLLDSIKDGSQKPFDDNYLIKVPSPLAHVHLTDDDATSSRASMSPTGASTPTQEATETPNAASESLDVPERLEAEGTGASAPIHHPTRATSTWADGRTAPPKWSNRRYACQRWHPLVCINQDLLLELRYIRDFHKIEGDERRQMTYSKAMAALKAYPHRIQSVKEAQSILAVGEKIAAQCGEYLKTGKIEAAEKVKASERHKTLMEFTKIHGVGSSTARELYDKHGCRTLADVAKISHKLPSMSEKSIELVEDFDVKIPRAEVEEIARTIDRHLQAIIVSCPYRPKPQLVRSDLDAEYLVQPGAIYTICGGYRRGKMESNDVDIVFTHPQESMEKGALEKLLDRLQQAGLVTEVLYIALTDSKRDSTMPHFHASHMDPLDKAFTVYKGPTSPVHRRVDLIATPYKYYACAVMGWVGSTIFERDLRLWADKMKGMKFDSGGLFERASSKEIIVHSEHEIFDVLGLEYIPPEWRNADV